jgi:hypothetical protein
VFILTYHIIVNETLPVFMHHLKQLNPVTHILAPTAASMIIGIAIYYSLIDLVWPLSSAYIFLPVLLILAIVITYYMRHNNVKMDTIDEENEKRAKRRVGQ